MADEPHEHGEAALPCGAAEESSDPAEAATPRVGADGAAAAAAAAPTAADAVGEGEAEGEGEPAVAGEQAAEAAEAAEGGEPASAPPAPAAAPLSWAERAALSAAEAASNGARHPSSSSTAPPPATRAVDLVDVQLAKDSVVEYLLFLAEQKAAERADGEAPELPEQLRKFAGCLDSGVPTTARSAYTRLGLANNANTCYVNVVIQSLLPCSALLWLLRRCNANDPRRPVTSGLVTLCKEFHTRKPDSHGEVLNALVLQQVKDIVASWQRLGAQQDAGEFLIHLLNCVHDECKWKVHAGEPEPDSGTAAGGETADGDAGTSAWAHVVKTNRRAVEQRAAGLHEDSPVTRIFGGLLQSAVRTRNAKVDSVSLEPFNHLALDIASPSVTSIRTALEAFCNAEVVNEGQATRRIQFKALPQVLILSLKRFSYTKGKGGAQKNAKPIKYEEKLVLDRSWLAEDIPIPDYHVTALICHHGDSVNRGHYTATVRYNSEWYVFDDTVIRRIEGKEAAMQHHTVYLLIYQSRGTVDMTP